MKNSSNAVEKRISHIESHSKRDVKLEIFNIENNVGDPEACARGLSGNAFAKAMFAYFHDHDLNSCRQWSYISSKLNQMWHQMEENKTVNPRGRLLQLLKPLLSNNEEIISWFKDNDSMWDPKRVANHKTHDFWAYQAIIALRGDWEKLTARCELVLSDPPGASSEKKYLIDHEFFLALAKGDCDGMKNILLQLVSPKGLRLRRDDEGGFTGDLISTYAVIYAKIASRHGHDVDINSPYMPSEWLDNTPLEKYDLHYSFLSR